MVFFNGRDKEMDLIEQCSRLGVSKLKYKSLDVEFTPISQLVDGKDELKKVAALDKVDKPDPFVDSPADYEKKMIQNI